MNGFSEARAKELGSDDRIQIGQAIAEGRVATLYLGRKHGASGRL